MLRNREARTDKDVLEETWLRIGDVRKPAAHGRRLRVRNQNWGVSRVEEESGSWAVFAELEMCAYICMYLPMDSSLLGSVDD